MAVQFLGWRPDVTPQYLQAETAREGLDIRSRQFEQALEDDAWERMFREREFELGRTEETRRQEGLRTRAELFETGRGERAEVRETGLGERAGAIQTRLGEQFDVEQRRKEAEAQTDNIMEVFNDPATSLEARKIMQDDPIIGPIIEKFTGEGFVPTERPAKGPLSLFQVQKLRGVITAGGHVSMLTGDVIKHSTKEKAKTYITTQGATEAAYPELHALLDSIWEEKEKAKKPAEPKKGFFGQLEEDTNFSRLWGD